MSDDLRNRVARAKAAYDDYRDIALQQEPDATSGYIAALEAALAEMGAVSEVGWQPLVKYDTSMQLVQVLCEVMEPELSEFPRSCEMPISAGDNGVGEMFVSIGWQDDDGTWFVAGWDMMQDCWTDARCFDVKMWKPLAAIEPAPASVREAALEAEVAQRSLTEFYEKGGKTMEEIEQELEMD